MFSALLELFTGAACRPDVLNRNERLGLRLAGRTVLGVSVNHDTVKLAVIAIDKRGLPTVGEVQIIPTAQHSHLPPLPLQQIAQLTAKHKIKDALLSVGTGWFSNLIQSRFGGTDTERNQALLERPEDVVPGLTSAGFVPGVISHPQAQQSLVFNIPREGINVYRDALESSCNLTVCRIQSGCFSIADHVISHFSAAQANRDLLIVDHSGLLLVMEENGSWTAEENPGFASSIEMLNEELVRSSLQDLLSRRHNPEKAIALVCTIPALDTGLLASMLEGIDVTRLTDRPNFDFYALASDYQQAPKGRSSGSRVAIDLNPVLKDLRPHISKNYQKFAYITVLLVAGIIVATKQSYNRNARIADATERMEKAALDSKNQYDALIKNNNELEKNQLRAERLSTWANLATSVQPIVVTAIDSAPNDVTIEKFILKLSEGQPQMELTVDFRGPREMLSRAVDELTAKLSAGMRLSTPETTDLPPTTISPQPGLRLRSLFLLPSASSQFAHPADNKKL